MEDFGTVAELLSTRARQHPDRTLLIFGGNSISYGETEAMANRVANWLQSRGVRKGQVVASFLSNSIEYALIWLGCTKLGAVFAAINISLKRQDLAYTLSDLEASLIFVEPDLVATLNEATSLAKTSASKICVIANAAEGDNVPAVSFTSDIYQFADLATSSAEPICVPQRASDPIGILYTGGSTGMPKGVLLPNGWYVAGARRFPEFLEPAAGSVHFGLGQLFHANGSAIDILGPLYCGISAVISGGFSASRFWQQIRMTNAIRRRDDR